nr:methyltransferase domain containing protein [uncultured bacterium]
MPVAGNLSLIFDMSRLIKDKAARGQHLLEEAVLEVLLEARKNGDGLVRAIDIARRVDIYRKKFTPSMGNAITSGILAKLSEEKRIEQLRRRGPWKLTEEEFSKMSADQNDA